MFISVAVMELPSFRGGFVFGYLNLALVFALVLSGFGIALSWILYKPSFGIAILILSLLPPVVGTLREYKRRTRTKKFRYH